MKLVNTLEVLPSDYVKQSYNLPRCTAGEDPQGWYAYWHDSLFDSGLSQISPIALGSFLVDITTITDNELFTILKHKLADMDLSDIDDYVSAFFGGIAIMQADTPLIMPTCCGDLTSIYDWQAIKEAKEETWTMLWVGHPWVYYKRTQQEVIFSDYIECENNNSSVNEILVPAHVFNQVELMAQVEKCLTEQHDFQLRCAKIFKALGVESYNQLAKKVAGFS